MEEKKKKKNPELGGDRNSWNQEARSSALASSLAK